MNKFVKSYLLPASVFITGACVLIIEVVAVRVLSPYYGNTIFTVSSVISVILAALSIGYHIGGKVADKNPLIKLFFLIILASGILVIVMHSLVIISLPALSLSFSITLGPLISSLILFFLPAVLLGTLSPFAIKLQTIQAPEQGVGSVAGKMFFWSTLGSIFGSLLAGFVLIPSFGIDNIFVGTGIALFVLGSGALLLLGFKKKFLLSCLFFICVLIFANIFLLSKAQGRLLYVQDGIYEKISIYDGNYKGRPVRFFRQDKSSSGAMFLDTDNPADLVYDYTKYYSVYKVFNLDIKNALVIGGGAYSIPKALLAELPKANVDVFEIEPSLYDLSKKYFNLKDNPRLKNYTEDGRRLLKNSEKKYDLIFSDVYYSFFSIPSHFTSQEFFQIAKEKLSENGIFVANLIGTLSKQEPSFILSEIRTFQSVFENSYFFAVDSPSKTSTQNIIFVGYNSSKKMNLETDPDLKGKLINLDRFELSAYSVLTDNYSPVEYYVSKVLHRNFDKNVSVDGNEMLSTIAQQLRYGPRNMSGEGRQKVQKFLEAELKDLGAKVKTQPFQYTSLSGQKYELLNIVGSLNPENDRRIILATHYDSKKNVPGANDSASGTAVLLELVRIIQNYHTPLNVGVDFIFFDGEEGDEEVGANFENWQPIGSSYFAKNLNDFYKTQNPFIAIVLDMVCDKNLKIYKEESSVKYAKDRVDSFWEIGEKVDSRVFSSHQESVKDDHTPLNEAGIPSFLLIDIEYPAYHTNKDTLQMCSAQSLRTVAEATVEYIKTLK